MSTRSGKSIHKSFHENMLDDQTDSELTTERKTRSRRLKQNCEGLNVSLPNVRRRQNYVSHPATDEVSLVPTAPERKPARAAKKNVLKVVNTDVTETEPAAMVTAEPAARQTRRAKKLLETTEEEDNICDTNDIDKPVNTSREGKKSKKSKRKHSQKAIEKENDEVPGQVPKKKSHKKKGQKRSRSMIVDDIDPTVNVKPTVFDFKSHDTSIDSYHSAIGSSACKQKLNGTFDKTTKVDQETDCNVTLEMVSKKLSASTKHCGSPYKRKSRASEAHVPKDTTFDKTLVAAFDKNDKAQIILDTTFEKEPDTKRKSNANSSNTEKLDATFDKSPRIKMNSTVKSLDTTFDKSTDSSSKPDNKVINTTFEKKSLKADSMSSLISSDATDGTINVTFDKSNSNDNMCVDITSDESKLENILNTTPLLIESSMETSGITEATPVEKQKPSLKVTAPTLLRREGTFTTSPEKKQAIPAPVTPLKREGTFTKDGPDVMIMSPVPKRTTPTTPPPTTPTRRKSLPSPGCTPFSNKRKEKSVLNVTHSLEKSRRSSLSEPVRERLTRVMFCSPVYNPMLNTQQKSKVIKSSMKGSNKSFVFEENAGISRPGARKRSYTASDADEGRTKRTRLADDLQQSVDRLSRPRTPQSQAKSDQVTPSKKPPTPRAKSETKVGRRLPNFAALHQRRFERMESLDECQERKARRARQLLAPTGGLTVLERGSPKATMPAVPPKPATTEAEPKKPQKKTKPVEPHKSDKTGYTRFGFKLHTDIPNPFTSLNLSKNAEVKPQESELVTIPTKQDNPTGSNNESIPNPFSISSKKPENKDNKQLLKRPPTLPSLNGTTLRKEVAKQTIMREKSATSIRAKRDVTRIENRTIIRGVRTNRRFDLQMQSRNING